MMFWVAPFPAHMLCLFVLGVGGTRLAVHFTFQACVRRELCPTGPFQEPGQEPLQVQRRALISESTLQSCF